MSTRQRRSTYVRGKRGQHLMYAPKKFRAYTILHLLANPPNAEWFRNRRAFYPWEQALVADDPTNAWYPKYNILGRIFRQSRTDELLAALDDATSWEQRCDVLRILGWRSAFRAIPHVVPYMGSLVTQERICAARFVQQMCIEHEGRCDPDLVLMADLGLSPEQWPVREQPDGSEHGN